MNLRSPVHDMPNDNIISERHGHKSARPAMGKGQSY